MSEWKEQKLAEVAQLVKEVYRPQKGDHLPYIGLEHIQEQKLRLKSIGDSDSVVSHKYYFKCNDILFGKLRPYFRKVVNPNFDGVCSTDIWVIRALKNNDQKFLFYFLANQEFVDTANSGDSGTRMPRADWDFVKDATWQFPSLPEQRAIAAVFSSLDDKIDLLHRQNKTLESLAATLWRYYFDDNRQEIWGKCMVKDIADHEKQSIHPRKTPDTIFYYYSIPAFDESKMPIKEYGVSIQSNKYLVSSNTILFSKLNPHKDKRLWLIPEDIPSNSVCSTEFQVLLPKLKVYSLFLYGFLNHPDNYDEIAAGVGGTSGSHQRIDPDVIFKFPCYLPSTDILNEYNTKVEPIFNIMFCNKKQIQNLTYQRDALLPKIMSREIKVS
ncbi:MAG: restriction endonuclease subunit S [Candidatus Omnitrophica bacterium]|nr:restriction endonuclease subunit S [Candidatus Omnitrophota bacterium]MDD5736801.1 restriction endonuclease subunit S [Candidatus Omnitrophota bacterium]